MGLGWNSSAPRTRAWSWRPAACSARPGRTGRPAASARWALRIRARACWSAGPTGRPPARSGRGPTPSPRASSSPASSRRCAAATPKAGAATSTSHRPRRGSSSCCQPSTTTRRTAASPNAWAAIRTRCARPAACFRAPAQGPLDHHRRAADGHWRALRALAAPALDDPAFDTLVARLRARALLHAALRAWTAHRDAQALEQALQDQGVPAHVVCTADALSTDPDLLADGTTPRSRTPRSARSRCAMRSAESPPPRSTPAPARGSATPPVRSCATSPAIRTSRSRSSAPPAAPA